MGPSNRARPAGKLHTCTHSNLNLCICEYMNPCTIERMTLANKFAVALTPSVADCPSRQQVEKGAQRAAPSRRGTKHIGEYFSPDVSRQLRQIALDENMSVQALLGESLDMLFESRGKPTIGTYPAG